MKNRIFNTINKNIKIFGKNVNKHSPEILIGCGIVGFLSTCVLVAKEAPIAKEHLDILHEDLGNGERELTKGEIFIEEFKTVAPVYAPSVITGAVSIGCILGSYNIGSKRAAALATAYELTQAGFTEYRDKVKEKFGEKKANEVTNEIATDKVKNNPPTPEMTNREVVMTDGLSLFYDSYGGRWLRSSVDQVRAAEKEISDRLATEMWVPLNDLYYELGISNTKLGDMVGFSVETGIDIKFSSVIAPDSTPCMVIDYSVGPRIDFRGDYSERIYGY